MINALRARRSRKITVAHCPLLCALLLRMHIRTPHTRTRTADTEDASEAEEEARLEADARGGKAKWVLALHLAL